LDGASANNGNSKKSWKATVTFTVHDDSHNPVSGVTVSGIWSGGYTGVGSCVTDATGKCSIQSGNVPRNIGSTGFTLFDLSLTGATYIDTYNHDPENDCMPGYPGTAINILRP
jgi:hypothetical protein